MGAGHSHAGSQSSRLLLETLICFAGGALGLLLEHATVVPSQVVLACYLVSYVAGGWHPFLEAGRHLLQGKLEIDLLMLLAALGTAALGDWFEGSVLLFLFSLSHTLENFIGERTRRAISALMDLTPDEATVIRDSQPVRIHAEELAKGDVILVRPGERIPADSRIIKGATSIDQAPLTGESQPVDKTVGDPIFAGTLNQQGVIQAEVQANAGESTLARMVQLVEQARSERATSQQFTEWFGGRYSLFVLVATLLILLTFWKVWGFPFGTAFLRAMTFLVVASPCAVVISIPSAILSAISGAARQGILFKGGIHLERTAELKAFAFDKTGTLTIGRPRLIGTFPEPGVTADALLTTAAALEAESEHPLARAIVQAAKDRNCHWTAGEGTTAIVARGITSRLNGIVVRVGKSNWFGTDFPGPSSPIQQAITEQLAQGRTVIAVGTEQRFLGFMTVADTLRSTAAPAIARMKSLGIWPIVMLTGDRAEVAAGIAKELGLEARAELLPEDKVAAIQGLKSPAGAVGMMGDGMNDAPALAAADVGYSLGAGGTDVALETADVVLMSDDLGKLPTAVQIARDAKAVVRQNLLLAFGVMLSLLILTSLNLLPLPWAVFGHEGSTVLVILNGLRLVQTRVPQPVPNPHVETPVHDQILAGGG